MTRNEKIQALCESFRKTLYVVVDELRNVTYKRELVKHTLQNVVSVMFTEPKFRNLAKEISFKLTMIRSHELRDNITTGEYRKMYSEIVQFSLAELDKINDDCKSKTSFGTNTTLTPYNQFNPCGSIYIFEYAKLSTKHRHPAMAEADRLKDGGTPVQIVSTVKDNRQPFITPAELDQAVISALHDKVSKLERENAELREWKNRTLTILTGN